MLRVVGCVVRFLCVVFFFFKQKTAYEMRISDWSSDVCSSDLKGVPGRPSLFGTTHQLLDDLNLRSLDDLPSLPEIKDTQQLEAALEKLGKIGRASCRERVCQYV